MAEYRNVAQYQDQAFEWDPAAQIWSGGIQETSAGYLPMLFQFQDLVRSGQAEDFEAEQYRKWEAAARAIPTRDIASLTAGWQGQYGGQWGDEGWQEGNPEWWSRLDPMSPDVGPIVLGIRDKMDAGTASPQERQLYQGVMSMASDWDWRASTPQPSDVGFGLGDNLTGALMTLALGATGGLAAAPLFAGGAGLATTLGSLGTLSGIAGTGAGILGGATGQEWLSKAGLGLGALGGVLGGLGGLSSLWGTGVQSLSDAAKLASSAGKITGAIGSASGNEGLRQASRYLGQAGQLGQFGSGVLPSSVTDWSGDNAPLAANVAPGVSNLLSAADVATQRGGGMETDWGSTDWLDWSGGGQGALLSDAAPGIDWSSFTAGGPGSWAGQVMTDVAGSGGGGGGLLNTILGGLGSVGKFLGGGASWLGPAASALGGLGAGALGAHASSDAAALQAAALNRAMNLQEAQWLQSQANQAPWIQAGQGALGELTWRQAQEQSPALPGATPAISGANYALPGATPGWTPQSIDANAYRWTPGQGPRAADYRYTPGGIPSAAQYRYTPGAVPTLQGKELLANDPGYQFRQEEARKALEASALARGMGMSGPTLAALQERSQDLASQEYGSAWNRAAQQAQMREGWAQTASQLGFGQAMDETRLREQVNQIAAQQGWSQAQAEAVFREQMGQQASQQGFNQALQGQQWNVGQQQQYQNELYTRLMQQNQLGYGRDVYQNQTDYERQQQAYQQHIAEMTRQWNQASGLAGLGQVSTGQLGTQGQSNATQMAALLSQLGAAQGQGALSQGNSWMNALQNVGGAVQGGLANQQLLSTLATLNR